MVLNVLSFCSIIILFILSKIGLNITLFEAFMFPIIVRFIFFFSELCYEENKILKTEKQKKMLFEQIQKTRLDFKTVMDEVVKDLDKEYKQKYKRDDFLDDGG